MSNTVHIDRMPFKKADTAYIGDTWVDVLEIWEGKNLLDMTAADLSGATFTAKLQYPNGNEIETFSEGDGITVASNVVTITIPASITAAFVDKCCYSLDLQAVFASPAMTKTYVRYSITATNDIT